MGDIAGIGIGLRPEFLASLLASERAVDFLEIVPDNWLGRGQAAQLAEIRERWTLVPHSIHLSIGGPDPIDREFLAVMRDLNRRIDAPFFSDHVCYSTVEGIQTGELLPLPFSEEAVEHTVARIAQVRTELDLPIVLENPTYYATMPGSTMEEAAFLSAILAESGCGLLLDVNNVYVNGVNHGYDPYAFIDRIPMDRVRQLHVAGHQRHRELDTLVDNHGAPTKHEVWELFEHTLRRAGRLIPTVIERDNNIPPLDELLDELDLARRHAAAALGG
jgi:uncharacterized protein (UPF0276 family)